MKKEQVLVALLMVAVPTWFFVYRDSAVKTPPAKKPPKVTAPRPLPDATIRLGLLDHAAHLGAVGGSNIFTYRPKPVQNGPVVPFSIPIVQGAAGRAADVRSEPPAQPPSKVWKYEGFTKSGDRLVASLSEGNVTYPVVGPGDCLMGQYCIRRLTENLVEIEDLQLRERRAFQRVQ